MTLLLDAGALVALERNERSMWARLRSAQHAGMDVVTHGGILGQVWRGGRRQARFSRVLAAIDTRPLDGDLGRAAGELLRTTGQVDVIDAALVALATDGDEIVTSDAGDLTPLVYAAGREVTLIRP